MILVILPLAGAIVVGGLTTFTLQLNDVFGDPVSTYFDVHLKAACITDSTAPSNTSFCVLGPEVTPFGMGQYQVQFSVQTIW